MEKSVDTKNVFGALLTDLSTAFNSLPHYLIITKFNAYGFSHLVLNLVQNYLGNRKQSTKKNDSYSFWSDTLFRVPQGSILFNIFEVICFSSLKMLISQAMLMITHFMTHVIL